MAPANDPPLSGWERAVVGAAAGVVATVGMTLAMDAMFRRLNPRERYPLPPRELTERLAERTSGGGRATDGAMRAATLFNHLGFGAAAGLLYALARGNRRTAHGGAVSGTAYGLAVWTVSYLGWIPATGLLRTAVNHPARRNRLMIGAHVVWGSLLGCCVQRLSAVRGPFAAGALRDRPDPDQPA